MSEKFDKKFGFTWPIAAPEILPSEKHIYSYVIKDPFIAKKPTKYAYTKSQIHDIVERDGKFVPYIPVYELESTIIKRKAANNAI